MLQVSNRAKSIIRTWTERGLLIIAGLVFSVMLAEGLLRVAPLRTAATPEDRSTCERYTPGGAIGLTSFYKAGQICSNSYPVTYEIDTRGLTFGELGFRDDGIDKSRLIVALGDSFTFGMGVAMDEVWTERIESQTDYDVANFGHPGIGTMVSARVLENYALSTGPSLVVLGLFPNDFYDNGVQLAVESDLVSESLEQGNTAPAESASVGITSPSSVPTPDLDSLRESRENEVIGSTIPFYELRTWLLNNSQVYRLFGDFVRAQRDTCRVSLAGQSYLTHLAHWNQQLNTNDPAVQAGFTQAIQDLELIQTLADEANARFVVLVFPSKEQVLSDLIMQQCNQPLSVDKFEMIQQLMDYCDAREIICIDLTDAMKAHRENAALYFQIDGHWTAAGHQVIADAVIAELETLGYLP